MQANQFPPKQESTSQVCYSPRQMHSLQPSTLSSLSVPSSWNWEWRKMIFWQMVGRWREKCFLVSGLPNFSMCQSKDNFSQPPLMRPSSVGLKVFFSSCGFEFLWFFSQQRWKVFPSATHAFVCTFILTKRVYKFDGRVASVDRKTVQQWKFSFKKQRIYDVTISESRVLILLFIFP